MTLTVSLRIQDGIVIAADSLSTSMSQKQINVEMEVACPECGHNHMVGPHPVGQVNVPATTFSSAQKIFPFLGKFGVATFGMGSLAGKTMHFAMRQLEGQIEKEEVKGVLDAAERIGKRAHELLNKQLPDLDKASDEWFAVGFQVVGYDDEEAKTIILHVGKEPRMNEIAGDGCTAVPEQRLVSSLFGLYGKHPEDNPAFASFALQDAINYSEFLIGSVAAYQQFGQTMPGVGGEIDIGLVTPFDAFKWIKQKPLTKILEGRE